MADDVVERFNALDIGGFHALQFSSRGIEKLVLRLDDVYRVFNTTEDVVSNWYELQFNRILGGKINATGPWPGEIEHWKARRDSEFLSETLSRRKQLTYGEAFTHFELTCDQARFDVVAREFFMTVVSKAILDRGDDGRGVPRDDHPER